MTKLTNIHFVKNIVNKKVSNTVISKIVNSGMQARELYEAQKQASLLSKPILLLYAFERLALMLILTQNPQYESKEKHGVEHNGDKVIVRGRAYLQIFIIAILMILLICLKEYSFRSHDFVNKKLPIKENDLNSLFHRDLNNILLLRIFEEEFHREVIIHELDREFLFTFALSSL